MRGTAPGVEARPGAAVTAALRRDQPPADALGLVGIDFAERLATLARLRWGVAIAGFVYALAVSLLDHNSQLELGLPWPLFVVALPLAIAAYNALVLVALHRYRATGAAAAIAVVGDLAATTIAVYGTGGVASWVWSVYPLVTLEAAFVTERARWTWLAATAGVAGYVVGVAWAPALLPRLGLPPPNQIQGAVGLVAVKVSWVALMDAAAAVTGLVLLHALTRVHTALREAYLRLERQYKELGELDRLKSSFLSTVSHELRTPLAVIQGFAELLEDDRHLSRRGHEYVARIETEVVSLAAKITQMIDYAGLAALDRPPCVERVRVADLVAEVAAEARQEVAGAGLALFLEPVPEALELTCDASLVSEALRQLLRNARAATPRGGTIGIAVRPDDRQITLEVWDTGPGVPAPVVGALGRPFTQSGCGLTEHTPGMGLGLAYVQLVAALHGGALHIGEREGGGAAVRLSLPALKIQ